MSGVEPISFTVNANTVEVNVAANTPLIYVLRNDLELKGTRFGCGEGSCGACTVVVDGRAVTSCNTPVSSVSGSDVQTIEAMVNEPVHPIVAAILTHNAWQCGYCLSGIIMQARVLYDNKSCTKRQDIAESLATNLCRCGAHPRILDALSEVLCSEE